MQNSRFETIHKGNNSGRVTYVMSHAFRLHYNHSLEKALELSNGQDIQIILYREKEEQKRNNDFFYKGISAHRGLMKKITPNVFFFEEQNNDFYHVLKRSSTIIKDKAYLNEHRQQEDKILDFAKDNDITMILSETNLVVPVKVASDKEEYAARTIRPKIMTKVEQFKDIIDRPGPSFFHEQTARDILQHFIDHKLSHYDQGNDPSLSYTSELSPYLKFGFISPLEIIMELDRVSHPNKDDFIEELVVRRELSYNFIYYNRQYNNFHFMTYPWAYETMYAHENDQREYIYTIDDYIQYKTHDPYFNAAMKEMVELGYMHNYMRMYWAKKVIEWSPNYQEAYRILIYLNNYYFLDGNTPNGYTGVAWCFGKHDRAWTERPIFGKIRYMNQNGLKRKFDIDNYITKINRLVGD